MIDVEALQRENAALRARVDALIHEMAKLNERLAIAQRKQRKTASPPDKKPLTPAAFKAARG